MVYVTHKGFFMSNLACCSHSAYAQIHEIGHVVRPMDCLASVFLTGLSMPLFLQTFSVYSCTLFQLGLGTLWNDIGLTPGNDPPCSYDSESKAANEWRCLSGCTTTMPIFPCGHWSEDCLRREIMLPSLSRTRNPVSSITVASLEDLGYLVNYDGADRFTSNDILPDCRCNNNNRRQELNPDNFTKRSSPAQEAARANAVEFGKARLLENVLSTVEHPDNDEVTFAGSDWVSVIYADPDVVGGASSVLVTFRDF